MQQGEARWRVWKTCLEQVSRSTIVDEEAINNIASVVQCFSDFLSSGTEITRRDAFTGEIDKGMAMDSVNKVKQLVKRMSLPERMVVCNYLGDVCRHSDVTGRIVMPSLEDLFGSGEEKTSPDLFAVAVHLFRMFGDFINISIGSLQEPQKSADETISQLATLVQKRNEMVASMERLERLKLNIFLREVISSAESIFLEWDN